MIRQLTIQPGTIHRNNTIHVFISEKESVLQTLAYFDIFHYPLTRDEIKQFLRLPVQDALFETWLTQLVEEKAIFYFNGFYSLQNNPLLAHRRKQGNDKADNLLVKAKKIGRFLHQFPFVRAIGISGSLSKNFADEKADIDFFIITKANRLWIARTLMHLYKKLTYLTGRQHFYCMNYYIDEESFHLDEQNIFTAIELKTLLPVSGERTMHRFFEANQWVKTWLPSCEFRQQEQKDAGSGWLKKITEWMFSGRTGEITENYLFRLTQQRWKRKIKREKRNEKGARMALITGKHFAISNPGDFQEKVLALYQQKLSALENQYRDKSIISSAR